MGRLIKVIFIAFFIGVFCGSCMLNSNLTLFGVSTLQSPEGNEAGTLKSDKQEVEVEQKGMDKKGVLPWLFDKTFGGGG